MKNIFRYEFSMYKKSILIWGAASVAMVFMFYAIYPTFGSDMAFTEKLMASYPEEMLQAFGLNSGLPLSSVMGYTVFLFPFVQLLIAIQASNYGFSILSIEERELTADFLISKPVSRIEILNAKFFAATLALLITNIIMWLSTIGAIELFKGDGTYELKNIIVLFSSVIIFELFFLTVGMLVSVFTRKINSVLTFSLAVAFGTYILNAIRAIVGGEALGYLSPFYHFDASYILEEGKLNTGLLTISILFITFSLILTYVRYPKRDIHSL